MHDPTTASADRVTSASHFASAAADHSGPMEAAAPCAKQARESGSAVQVQVPSQRGSAPQITPNSQRSRRRACDCCSAVGTRLSRTDRNELRKLRELWCVRCVRELQCVRCVRFVCAQRVGE
jgi:hypothetical protein